MLEEMSSNKARKLIQPYLSGVSVDKANSIYSKLDTYTFQQLVDYIAVTRDRQLMTMIAKCGNELKSYMK